MGIGRLPARRLPSKLCAALDASRRLRMEWTITHPFDTGRWRLALISGLATLAMGAVAEAQESQQSGTNPLQLEGKIPLGSVRGRIDHMAIDLARRRLFVAELGNDSVGVV